MIGLQGDGLSWPEAAGVVLLLGAVVGLANGVLVTFVGIDSFIATLGMGTLIYGLNEWYTGGQQVVASLPDSFLAISGALAGIPLPALYVAIIGGMLFVFFEYLPAGRYLYVLGASPRTAELNGISARRYVTGAFLAAGVLAAFAGIVLQSQLEVGQSSVGPEYLLPAFTAALLGATSVKPGRVNVLGTLLAVGVLAVTVAGLNQLGAPFFVEPIFDGAMLILAVGLAVTAARQRTRLGVAAEAAQTAPAQPSRPSSTRAEAKNRHQPTSSARRSTRDSMHPGRAVWTFTKAVRGSVRARSSAASTSAPAQTWPRSYTHWSALS